MPKARRDRYRAFISYSHQDERWAKFLQRKLEAYRVPRDLVGTTSKKGKLVPDRLGKIFRDREDASAAPDLAEELRDALAASENLIVVCSPASAASRHVHNEIVEFKATGPEPDKSKHIFAFVVAANDDNGSVSSIIEEHIPPALRGRSRGDGTGLPEPLAADARPLADGKNKAFLKLVAGLLGVSADDILNREQKRRRQSRLFWGSVGSAMLLASLWAGFTIETGRQNLERTERDRNIVNAVNVANLARSALAAGNFDQAVALAKSGLATDGSMPFIPQAYAALYSALVNGNEPRTLDIIDFSTHEEPTVFELADGTYFTWSGDGGPRQVSIWSPSLGIVSRRSGVGTIHDVGPSATPNTVFVGVHNAMLRYVASRRNWVEISYGSELQNLSGSYALSPERLLGCLNSSLYSLEIPPSEITVRKAWHKEIEGANCESLALAPDGTILMGNWDGDVFAIDGTTHEIYAKYEPAESSSVRRLFISSKYFAAVGIGHTEIFEFGRSTPVLSFENDSRVSPISPSGKFVVERSFDWDSWGLRIHDLTGGPSLFVECECEFAGFYSDGNILVLENSTRVDVRDIETGHILETLHTFTQDVDSIHLLERDDTLVGFRGLSADTVVKLNGSVFGKPLEPLVPDESRDRFLWSLQLADNGSLLAFYAETGDFLVSTFRAKMFDLIGNEPARELWNKGSPDGSPVKYKEMLALGNGLLGVWDPDGMFSDDAGEVQILEVETGNEVLARHANRRPLVSSSGELLVFDDEKGIWTVDLIDRTVRRIWELDLHGVPIVSWQMSGNAVFAAQGGSISVIGLGGRREPAVKQLEVGGVVHNFCPADEDHVFVVFDRLENGEAYHTFALWSVPDGKLLADVVPDLKDKGVADIVSRALFGDTRELGQSIACTSDGMSLTAEEASLVWQRDAGLKIIPAKSVGAPDADPVLKAPQDINKTLIDPKQMAHLHASIRSDGIYLTGTSLDEIVRVFPFQGSTASSVAYLPSKGWLIAGYENGMLRAWDISAPEVPVISVKAHDEPVRYLVASPDEDWVISGDFGGVVRRWPIPTVEQLLANATDLIGPKN